MSNGEVLLVDHPGHPYALRYMRVFYEQFGIKSVCVYLDEASMRNEAPRTPEFGSDMVSGLYLAPTGDYDAIAGTLRRNHDIRAVAPYIETALTPSIQLGRRLGISWAENESLELFRNKYALKARLRSVPDGPRVNRTALVRSVADVRRAVASGGFDHFVLKPNGGFGNAEIAFFGPDSTDEDIAAHLANLGADALMEEFIGGSEYVINGQVDTEGLVTVLGVFLIVREQRNGRDNVQTESRSIHSDDPAFLPLKGYVEHLINASGLRRSPFHVDAKFDAEGPGLIEVGARLAGVGGADDVAYAHSRAVDPFALSAHYYLTAESAGPVPTDWPYYESHVVNTVMGVSEQSGRIWELSGVGKVEAMPQYRGWVMEPRTGQRIVPTVDRNQKRNQPRPLLLPDSVAKWRIRYS